MRFTYSNLLLSLLLVGALISYGSAQVKPGEGTAYQRLEVMGQKLSIMRRSLNSAASVLKDESKGEKTPDDKTKADTPLARLVGLEKEAARLLSEVSDLRGKVDRSEKYENSEVDSLEQAVAELQTRVDAVQLETAKARAIPDSPVGKPRDKKSKKEVSGNIWGRWFG